MPSITYQAIHHNRENRILVLFAHDVVLNSKMRQVAGVKWSRTYKGWTIPDTAENRMKCKLPAANAVQTDEAVQPAKVVSDRSVTPFAPQISENNLQQLAMVTTPSLRSPMSSSS